MSDEKRTQEKKGWGSTPCQATLRSRSPLLDDRWCKKARGHDGMHLADDSLMYAPWRGEDELEGADQTAARLTIALGLTNREVALFALAIAKAGKRPRVGATN